MGRFGPNFVVCNDTLTFHQILGLLYARKPHTFLIALEMFRVSMLPSAKLRLLGSDEDHGRPGLAQDIIFAKAKGPGFGLPRKHLAHYGNRVLSNRKQFLSQ